MRIVVRKKSLTWWSLLSPITALVLSLAIAAVSILLPRSYYERVVGEHNYIYHNPRVALYIAICALAFLVGFALHKYVLAAHGKRDGGQEFAPGNRLSIMLPLVIVISTAFIVVNVYGLIAIYNTVPLSTITSSLLGDASSTTLRLSVTDTFAEQNIGIAFRVGVALVPWLVLVALSMSPTTRRIPLGALAMVLMSSLLSLIIINAVFTQSRSQLLYPMFAAFVVWCAVRINQDRLKLRTLLPVGLVVSTFAVGYFALVAITRQGLSKGGVSPVEEQLVGYFVGSYNRFAAMLEGTLTLPSEGGYYWTQWLWEMPFISGLVDSQRLATSLFGAPGPSQFEDVYPYVDSAGLEHLITSLTIFSYTYADFGWFGFVPFIAYGFISRMAWVAFRNGNAWAVIIYPYILWSIVEWRGYIEITRASSIATFVFLAVAVAVGRLLIRSYLASNVRLRRPAGNGWPRESRRLQERGRHD